MEKKPFLVIPLALAKRADVSPQAKLFYGFIRKHGYPSVKVLAQMAGLAEPTARKALKELEALGWVMAHRRKSNDRIFKLEVVWPSS